MKKLLLTITAALCCTASIFAASKEDPCHTRGLRIEHLQMERVGDFIHLDMKVNLAALDISTTEVAVLTPCIKNGTDSIELQAIGIYGRNRHIYYQRNPGLNPTTDTDLRYRENQKPDTIRYQVRLPYMEWMNGCTLEVNRSTYGCCGKPLCSNDVVLVPQFPLDPYIPELIYIRPTAEAIKTRELSGSAFVDFPVSQTVIYPDYRNNRTELAKITGSIDSVKADPDITITALSVKGFASPESPYDNNTRLAKGRTLALKRYVEDLYHFDDTFIATDYEPENWEGLEAYVEASSLPHRDEILAAIRSNREPDNKEWYIKSNWRDDYKYLLEHCYPALRRTDYRIEYVIREYSTPEEIECVMHTAPQKLSLDEFYVLAQTYEPGSEELDELWEIAVRMYPHDEIANLNAANSAMLKGDYTRALRYLDRAGSWAETTYSRGALEALREDYDAARPILQKAAAQGVVKAQQTLDNMRNHWKVSIDYRE